MIKTPDKRVIEALAMLEHNGHFQDIVEWLNESKLDTEARLIEERDEVETRRLQGAGRDLTEILKHAAEARQLINQNR